MIYLLDTHSLLWAVADRTKLSRRVRAVIEDWACEVRVSPVSLWEISTKYALGKLVLEGKKPEDLPLAVETLGFEWLPLDPGVASSFHLLPQEKHRDPFDRMLVWQAIQGGLTLISVDSELENYAQQGLRLLW